MSKVYVFQHAPHENLGSLEPALKERGVEIHYVHSYRQALEPLRIHELPGVSGLIVMGGPMSANDSEKLPFLREELRLIEEALKADLPYLGICLGSQLLAKTLGARVYPGPKKEIGWYPLQLRPEADFDPLLQGFPRPLEMFQWHGETFDLPAGSTGLAFSEIYAQQAFRYGDKAYGLQFHPEMTPAMIAEWQQEGKNEIEAADLQGKWQDIDALNAKHLPGLEVCVDSVARGFVSLLNNDPSERPAFRST